MPRKKQEVEDAVDGYKSGKYSSVSEAAWITGIPKMTIGAHLKGRPTRRKGQETNQKLAHAEEDEVARQVRIAVGMWNYVTH